MYLIYLALVVFGGISAVIIFYYVTGFNMGLRAFINKNYTKRIRKK